MRRLIEKFFKEAVQELFGNRHPDMKNMILNSPRRHEFFDRMVKQVKAIEKHRTKKIQKDGTHRLLLTRDKIKNLVKDFVKLFGQAVVKSKELEMQGKTGFWHKCSTCEGVGRLVLLSRSMTCDICNGSGVVVNEKESESKIWLPQNVQKVPLLVRPTISLVKGIK